MLIVGQLVAMIDGWVKENLDPPYFFLGSWIQPNGDRVRIWEDAFFCQMIRAKGGLIYGVPSVRVGHYDTACGLIDDSNVEWLRKRSTECSLVHEK
jgi:hypothetical protein